MIDYREPTAYDYTGKQWLSDNTGGYSPRADSTRYRCFDCGADMVFGMPGSSGWHGFADGTWLCDQCSTPERIARMVAEHPHSGYPCPVCGAPQPIAGATCGACVERLREYDRAAAEGRLVVLPMAIGTEVWTITGLGAGVDHVDFYEVGEGKIQWFATDAGDEFDMDDEGKTWWRTDEAAWAEVERRRGL